MNRSAQLTLSLCLCRLRAILALSALAAMVVVPTFAGAADPATPASAPKPAKAAKPAKDKASAPARALSTLGKGTGNGLPMTKEELRVCLSQQQAITADEADLKRQQKAYDDDKAAVLADGATLQQELAALDRTDPVAVAAFNAKAADRDRRIDELQARVPAFNARVDAAQDRRSAWDSKCNNRKFFEDDQKELEAEAAKAPK